MFCLQDNNGVSAKLSKYVRSFNTHLGDTHDSGTYLVEKGSDSWRLIPFSDTNTRSNHGFCLQPTQRERLRERVYLIWSSWNKNFSRQSIWAALSPCNANKCGIIIIIYKHTFSREKQRMHDLLSNRSLVFWKSTKYPCHYIADLNLTHQRYLNVLYIINILKGILDLIFQKNKNK